MNKPSGYMPEGFFHKAGSRGSRSLPLTGRLARLALYVRGSRFMYASGACSADALQDFRSGWGEVPANVLFETDMQEKP